MTGAVATRIGTVPHRWTGRASAALGRPWRWALAAATLGFLTLVPGLVLLAPLLPQDATGVVSAVIAFTFTAFAVALVTARAQDRTDRRRPGPPTPGPTLRAAPKGA